MKLHISRTFLSSSSENHPDRQGWLYKKSFRTASYHPCWCELRGNILFCRERHGDRGPPRLIILEGCTVELRESASEQHTFEISYPGDLPGIRSYKMAAENQETMESWVRALSMAGSGYLRALVTELEGQFQMLKSQQYPKLEGEARHLITDLKLSPSDLGELGTLSTDFAQLHGEFGEEIVKLRHAWQEMQAKPQPEDELLVDIW